MLKHLSSGKLVAFDMDEDAIKNIRNDERFLFVRHNFRYMKNFLRYYGIHKVDGILADLGVSSHQFEKPNRGFSFRTDGQLDMRMNPLAEKNAQIVINTYPEDKLFHLFREYGEIQIAKKIANLIIKNRKESNVKTINQFVEIIKPCLPGKSENNKFLAKIFQAIRIEVNEELENLKELLKQSVDLLSEKGRLAIISYHSLEDRLVKNFIRCGNFEGIQQKDFYGNIISPLIAINKNVIVPSETEIAENNRARSAKLRIAERKSSK